MSETSLDADILRVKRYLRAGLASKGDIIAVLNRALKEREPVKPRMDGNEPECGVCLYELRRDADSYCPCCGRKVKWDE